MTPVMHSAALLSVIILASVIAPTHARTPRGHRTSRTTNLGNKLRTALECGDVCTYVESPPSAPQTSTGVAVLAKHVHCPHVWTRMLSSCPSDEWPPPSDVPVDMAQQFTMDGAIITTRQYLQQRYSGQDSPVNMWEGDDLTRRIAEANLSVATQGVSTYGDVVTAYVDTVLSKYDVAGQVGMVWGSELPWAEIIVAKHGAESTVTVDYGKIVSTHSSLLTTTPRKFAAVMLTDRPRFDFAFTYSSLEHSGLGRYGDQLNPHGDLEAVAQTWCALKPGALFFLGLPAKDAKASVDELVWNAHRLYGPLRLAQMFAGFEHVDTHYDDSVYGVSLIHVLRKPAKAYSQSQ